MYVYTMRTNVITQYAKNKDISPQTFGESAPITYSFGLVRHLQAKCNSGSYPSRRQSQEKLSVLRVNCRKSSEPNMRMFYYHRKLGRGLLNQAHAAGVVLAPVASIIVD